MEKEVVHEKEVLELLGTNRRNLDRAIRLGQFPQPLKVGLTRIWPAAVIRDWLTKPYTEGK